MTAQNRIEMRREDGASIEETVKVEMIFPALSTRTCLCDTHGVEERLQTRKCMKDCALHAWIGSAFTGLWGIVPRVKKQSRRQQHSKTYGVTFQFKEHGDDNVLALSAVV
jgi:hypothetical protein